MPPTIWIYHTSTQQAKRRALLVDRRWVHPRHKWRCHFQSEFQSNRMHARARRGLGRQSNRGESLRYSCLVRTNKSIHFNEGKYKKTKLTLFVGRKTVRTTTMIKHLTLGSAKTITWTKSSKREFMCAIESLHSSTSTTTS